MTQSIGIDLGGTRIKAVLLDHDGHMLHSVQRTTNDNSQGDWKAEVLSLAREMQSLASTAHTPIGLSAPGLTNATNDRIVLMPGRLQGLEHFEWSSYLESNTWVLNDAHAALMGEALLGAGKGHKNIILLTLGTGVGGAVMIEGKLHQGLLNRAGHLGHITLNADSDELDITGMPASLEDAIGNASIQKRSFGKYKRTDALVADYQKGDVLATYIWLHSVKRLAVGVGSLINVLSPDLIVIGGGIATVGEALFGPLREFMKLFEWQHSNTLTPISPAVFYEYSGAVGAAVFAQQQSDSIIN